MSVVNRVMGWNEGAKQQSDEFKYKQSLLVKEQTSRGLQVKVLLYSKDDSDGY